MFFKSRTAYFKIKLSKEIWRLSLVSNPEIPSPDGHGWYFDERGELAIRWIDCRPALDEILELVSGL